MGFAEFRRTARVIEPLVCGERKFAEMRDCLFAQQEPATKVYFLERGYVALQKVARDGTVSFLGLLMPGDVYRERSEVHQCYARAFDGANYLIEERSSFDTRIARDPEVTRPYMQSLELQLQRQRELAEIRNHLRIVSRFAGLLLWMLENMPYREANASAVVGVKYPFRQSDIATILNTHREAVSKMLGILKSRGIIEYPKGGGVLFVLCERSLRRLVDRSQGAFV